MAAGGELDPHVHIPVAAPVNINIGLALPIIMCNCCTLSVYEDSSLRRSEEGYATGRVGP